MMRLVVFGGYFCATQSVFVIHGILQMNRQLQVLKLRLFFVYFNHFLIMVFLQKGLLFRLCFAGCISNFFTII